MMKEMNCETFRENVHVMWDKYPDPERYEACRRHVEACQACRRHYESLAAVAHGLVVPCEPPLPPFRMPEAETSRSAWPKRLLRVAAVVAVFLLGVGVGLSRFFSTDARAVRPFEVISQSLRSLQCTGNFVMHLRVRTMPADNFAHWSADAPFIDVSVMHFRQDGVSAWRIEKAGGRTLVCNGADQYMWVGTRYVKTDTAVNLAEGFGSLLHPERLLQQEKALIAASPQRVADFSETDSTIRVCVRYDKEFLHGDRMASGRFETEQVFSKADHLLRSVRLWFEYGGRRTLLLETAEVRYNVVLTRAQVTRLPELPAGAAWKPLAEPSDYSVTAAMRREKAAAAAGRIMRALTEGSPDKARASLCNFEAAEIAALCDRLKGCRIEQVAAPMRGNNYAGVFVTVTLRCADGTLQKKVLSLRNDNDQHVWILDGGL